MPGTLTGLRGCKTDSDWYALEVAAGATVALTATVTAGTSSGIRRLTYVDPNGAATAETSVTDPITLSATAQATGTAYVVIQYWDDDIVYDLTIAVSD